MMEKKRIQTEIVLRAKEAQRAATLLKNAEARSEAAKQVWKRKMAEARQTAREEQERVRLEVELKIKSGAEAALIQAEAALRAKTLRETAFKEATATFNQYAHVEKITAEANERAAERQIEENSIAS